MFNHFQLPLYGQMLENYEPFLLLRPNLILIQKYLSLSMTFRNRKNKCKSEFSENIKIKYKIAQSFEIHQLLALYRVIE